MISSKNCLRHSRDMQNAASQMSYENFLGIDNANTFNIDNLPIAMAYVPYQQWQNIYDPREALKRGTIFKELDLPFTCAKECK